MMPMSVSASPLTTEWTCVSVWYHWSAPADAVHTSAAMHTAAAAAAIPLRNESNGSFLDGKDDRIAPFTWVSMGWGSGKRPSDRSLAARRLPDSRERVTAGPVDGLADVRRVPVGVGAGHGVDVRRHAELARHVGRTKHTALLERGFVLVVALVLQVEPVDVLEPARLVRALAVVGDSGEPENGRDEDEHEDRGGQGNQRAQPRPLLKRGPHPSCGARASARVAGSVPGRRR